MSVKSCRNLEILLGKKSLEFIFGIEARNSRVSGCVIIYRRGFVQLGKEGEK